MSARLRSGCSGSAQTTTTRQAVGIHCGPEFSTSPIGIVVLPTIVKNARVERDGDFTADRPRRVSTDDQFQEAGCGHRGAARSSTAAAVAGIGTLVMIAAAAR